MKPNLELLNEFLKNSNVSMSALARAIGVSAGAVSQYRKGEYKGDNALLGEKIANYITNFNEKKAKNAKKEPKKDEIFISNDFKRAFFVINEAVDEHEIALIYGEAGTGKTTILKEYAKAHSNAVLIEVTPHTTPRVMLEILCEALKIAKSKGLRAMLKDIAHRLALSDRIILIDEAEHLPLKALEDLRRIADFSRTPLVLCGTEVLLNNLTGKRYELKQLYSRICGKHIMQGLSRDESREFFGEWIYEFAKRNFRSSAKLYKKAKKLAEFNNMSVNREITKEAVSMILLDNTGE